MSRIVSAWSYAQLGGNCLAAKDGDYVCLDCGLVIRLAPNQSKGASPEVCPFCVANAKQPTPKLDASELEKRKTEMRERMK
jgi:predicted unusual protein kinase regulating ubiquinone biosynthesis (AarF/ABC1/UbiB family)